MKTHLSDNEDLRSLDTSEAQLRSLIESEVSYRTLVEFAADAMMVSDSQGRLLDANTAGCGMFGYARDELLKLSNTDLIAPDELARMALTMARLSAGKVERGEWKGRRKDGTTFPCEVCATALSNGRRLAILRDISARKQDEAAHRASEECYRTALTAIHEAVIVVGRDGIMQAVNPSCERMFGLKPEQMIGQSVVNEAWRTVRADGTPFPISEYPALVAAREGRPLTDVVAGLYNPGGEMMWISMNAEPLFRPGETQSHGAVVSITDITARKRAEAALRESEKRLEAIVANTPNVAVEGYDIDGRVLYWNKAAEKIFGYTAAEAVGKTLDQLILDPEASGEFVNVLRLLDRTEQTLQPTEWKFKNRNGTEGHLYSTIFPIPARGGRKEFVCMDVDISELKRVERELARSLSLLQATLESTADGILVVDCEGKVRTHNRKFAEMWRIPRAALDSGDDNRLLAFVLDQLADPESFLKKVRELYAQPDTLSFDVLVFKDGRVFERYSQPQKIGGACVGRVWSFRDITSRAKAEQDRLALERKLLETQKLESLGVLAGGIAHDFNNLLAAVLGNVSLAAMQISPDSPVRPFLSSIETTTHRAAELCKQMLAYSGKGRFVVQPVDVNALIQEMAELLRISISKNISLAFNLAPSLPPVAADATQLRQVVMNLIINASEAIGTENAGVISLTSGMCQIDHAVLAETYLAPDLPAGGYLFLEVADNGCGMDAATKARIFDPFYTTKFTGRGLGLAAVLGIVRGHRGAIKLDSAVGHGTTFRILLPCGTSAAPSAQAEESAGAKLSGRLLLAEDDDMLRTLQARMIESVGLSAQAAENGPAALAAFRAGSRDFTAALIDLSMPGMGGEELCMELLSIRLDFPILLMSGFAQADVVQRCSAKGRVGFIQKPFTPADLIRELSLLLKTP